MERLVESSSSLVGDRKNTVKSTRRSCAQPNSLSQLLEVGSTNGLLGLVHEILLSDVRFHRLGAHGQAFLEGLQLGGLGGGVDERPVGFGG